MTYDDTMTYDNKKTYDNKTRLSHHVSIMTTRTVEFLSRYAHVLVLVLLGLFFRSTMPWQRAFKKLLLLHFTSSQENCCELLGAGPQANLLVFEVLSTCH